MARAIAFQLHSTAVQRTLLDHDGNPQDASGRSLPWQGCSTMCLLMFLAACSCKQQQMGGLGADSRPKTKLLLDRFLAAMPLPESVTIRLDVDVKATFGCSHLYAVQSHEHMVVLTIESGMVNLDPLRCLVYNARQIDTLRSTSTRTLPKYLINALSKEIDFSKRVKALVL